MKTRAIWNGDFDSLTAVEWSQIRDYELARSARLEDVFFQYNQGLIDENMYKFALAMGASRLGLWKWLNVGEPNPEFAVAIATFMEDENFKATLLATSFEEWSKDKERPNRGLGSPFVFK